MLGKRSDQKGLWEADRLYLDYVGQDTFYGLLASLRGQLFSDDDFAEIYCPDNGRDSVPPSLLATALLLQTYDKVSDAEAKARADFDIRWKVALGIEIEDRPFAKSTLQMFRAQLILHDKVREVFEGSLRLARQSGYLKKRGMRVALDTTYILGRGAVKDTYNLLADGIVKLLRVLAAVANIAVGEWAEAQGYQRYFGSSIKGEATIDWSDRKARRKLLGEIVADADRLLELARQAWVELPEDSAQRQSIVDGAELLGQLLLQDIERKSGDGDVDAHADDADDADDGVSIRDGVSKDRMLSVHDPELRHGHKSSRRRFNGHKAAIVVDTDSQLITAVDVLPGNAPDNLGALELVEQSEAIHVRLAVAQHGVNDAGQFVSRGSDGLRHSQLGLLPAHEAMGDAAYGDGGTRQAFADAGRRLVAKAPGRPDRKHFPKNDFQLDLAAGSCTCPAGQVTRTIVPAGKRTDGAGRVYRLQAFQFDGAVCVDSMTTVSTPHSGMSAPLPVHRGPRQEGSPGADPSPGRHVATGPGLAAKRRLRRVPTIWGPWNWWSRVKRVPARWWTKPWATPPMGTAGPARPSPTRDAGWWPKRRAGPTGNTGPAGHPPVPLPIAGFPVRRGGMWGMSAPLPVHRGPRQEGSPGADPSPGRHVATGPGLAAKRRLRRVSSATGGSGAQIGAAGPAGHPPVPLLR